MAGTENTQDTNTQNTTEQNKPNYKDTLNLPETEFPMRGNLPQREPEQISFWTKNKIYQKMVEKNEGKDHYVMPDGPPYANGNIHIGHVLNKVLKDIVIKYRNLSGSPAHFIPGWDCHGLPIEHKVTKELGPKRKEKSKKEIRELCRQEARKWVGIQKEEFVRLGIMAEWENPYLTIDPTYEAEEVRELGRVLENGILYRGEKPVHWCWALQTALAEAEVEYAPHKSPSIDVKFNLADKQPNNSLSLPENTSLVIWTTTPWTLPSNLAIAVGADFEYGVFKTPAGDHIIIATELQENLEARADIKLEKVQTLKGSELDGLVARHPFIDRDSLVLLGHHVSLEAGTGCVHIAPGHGQDDYQVGLKYGLDILSPVDEAGLYTPEVPDYEGEHIFKCNPKIVERLRGSGHLLAHKEIEHSYPHCWRSKTPLIFRATPQWFLRVDDENYNVRQKALDILKDIRFVPAWGEARMKAMIENRPDWCLSRQRIWGVPIPVFYCQSCGKEKINKDLLFRIADQMEENGGLEAYFEGDTQKLLGDDSSCDSCGHSEFTKGQDILDVWFDSGVCHAAVQGRRKGMKPVADIYLEGSDQHRGWFQTSLLSSISSRGEAPFKALVTHGFVNDAKGRKMSKSLGNVIAPQEWIQKSGAEILRLFAAYEDYGQDLNCGPENFKRITESYRRFRNTMRFLLGNLNGFSAEQKLKPSELLPLDQWALHRLNLLVDKITNAYENYEFYKVYHALNHFMTVELSATYLDILKDRLYTASKNGKERKSAQTVLFHLVHHLTSLMAPILSFLSEETYQLMPGKTEESIFLVPFPKTQSDWSFEDLDSDFTTILEIRSEILKKIEELRNQKVVRSSLEAQVQLSLSGDKLATLQKHEEYLAEYFIVSQVHLSEGDESLEVTTANGKKCERCWHYALDTDADSAYPMACGRCVEALKLDKNS